MSGCGAGWGVGRMGTSVRGVDQVPPDQIRRLHRDEITDPIEIRGLFERLRVAAAVLDNGVDRRSAPRRAQVIAVSEREVVVRSRNIQPKSGRPTHFTCDLEGSRFFFSLYLRTTQNRGRLKGDLPASVYQAERREMERQSPLGQRDPRRVELRTTTGERVRGSVLDWSYQGIGVSVPSDAAGAVGETFEIEFLDGLRAGERVYGALRNRDRASLPSGWTRLGIEVSRTPLGDLMPIERRRAILGDAAIARTLQEAAVAGALLRGATTRLGRRWIGRRSAAPKIETAEYLNDRGQVLRAIIDRAGAGVAGTAIVIPPAWGRTKETLVALAMTVVRTFERAGEPVLVVRFDGSNRRGESHVDPECRTPGDEYLKFTFSQAVRDIHATLDFLRRTPGLSPKSVILVTFSLAAIEGRRAVATDPTHLLAGWISVVGMVDLQSGLRAVSGGVDYAAGLMRGVHFGRHELVGVVADMDHTGRDALDHRLVFLEDARQDMAQIRCPVTWIHGRYDAWIDVNRVRNLLSSGDSSNRRLIEIPAGHQLRSSREALQTFQLVASEAARMALGRTVETALPDLRDLEDRERAERARRPASNINLREFWHGYLLGRDRRLGIELMTATTAYREFMEVQAKLIAPREGDVVLDLGAGTGGFLMELAAQEWPSKAKVIAVDVISEALARARERALRVGSAMGSHVRYVSVDLSAKHSALIPLTDESVDGVLASLLLSYVTDPKRLLAEARRCLRPGGRLVVSSLRKDADISGIYADGFRELQPDRLRELFGKAHADAFPELQRLFLNDAARLIDLEELGYFRFWERGELAGLIRSCGFTDVRVYSAFGRPPQAIVAVANAPMREG